jgi:hypothetical protein
MEALDVMTGNNWKPTVNLQNSCQLGCSTTRQTCDIKVMMSCHHVAEQQHQQHAHALLQQ